MVAKPAGVRTVITGIPSHTGHDASTPRRYFRLGGFTLGNVDGFAPAYPFEYAQQLLYPIPAVWELLAYDIRDGASCLFQELVDVPDLTLKQPWDRTPLAVNKLSAVDVIGGTGLTTAWTYTVPAGRRLFVSGLSSHVVRLYAASAHAGATATIYVDGVMACNATTYSPTPGVAVNHDSVGAPMMFPAGTVFTATHNNGDTGGYVRCRNSLIGFLFDT